MLTNRFKAIFHRSEDIFTVLALIFYAGAVFKLVLSGGANQNQGTQYDASLIQLIAMSIYSTSGALLALRWRKVIGTLVRDPWLLAILGLALLSILWSEAPAFTIRRNIALVGTSLFGVYMATRYTLQQQLKLLAWAFGIMIILSLLFVVAFPSYGISGGLHEGAWRGVWAHKNGLGQKMALSTLVFTLLALNRPKWSWLLWGGAAISVALVILAASTAGLIATVVMLGTILFAQVVRWRRSLMVPGLIVLGSGAILLSMAIAASAETLLTVLGEDTTLTGRTEFWPYIIRAIQEQPWLGYGYEAFWRGFNGPSAWISYALQGSAPNHAHNGILQIWLYLGVVGVIVFLIGFWTILLRSIRWARMTRSATDFWPLIYCLFIIQVNISESVVLEYNEISWVLYVAVSLSTLSLPQQESMEPSIKGRSPLPAETSPTPS